MEDFSISQMMELQTELWRLHRNDWDPMEPEYGRNSLLWMMEEVGEVAAIIKKKGDGAIMEESEVRTAFVEELSDVLMYYMDTLLRYGVSPEEISAAYRKKHDQNMGRDYQKEYGSLLHST